jgi:DNA repair protein RecN (Recombination protein N)
MLLSLTLADFVLVERLSLDFQAGFSVLTGETGAGKSILLDALALALGERADAGVVRAGADRAEVSAEFDLTDTPGLAAWLDEQDLAGEENVLLLRRVVEAGGRSRTFINGRPATAQQLKAAGEFLVDIHGQHAHYSLLKPAEQRRLLDAYAGATDLADQVGEAWRLWRQARARRLAAESHSGQMAAEREELEETVAELQALDYSPEGWQSLQEEQRRLAHATELVQGVQLAAEALEGDEAGLIAQLRGVRARLAELAQIDPALAALHDTLDGAAEMMQDTARQLRRYGERVDLDPHALMLVESRLAAIQAAARKHRIRPEAIPDALRAAQARLAELGEAADLAALARAEEKCEADYRQLAARLGHLRAQAAEKLARAVTEVMQQLAMGGGRFSVDLPMCEAGAQGLEEVVFLVSPHAGQALQPMSRTASGGELSRLGLALQTVLSEVSGAPTLIFDEVDVGIGGGVAEIVGRLLAEQGKRRQVLCVTHLPQVAARGAWHYLVSKIQDTEGVRTRVTLLEEEARVEELARMLGGVEITETTRRHAAEMLGASGAPKATKTRRKWRRR